ncbi:MAG: response regulator [candidate division Zixibacteria bacterium]|nr:response regulator [candidate division Zixibacteria bacterium]
MSSAARQTIRTVIVDDEPLAREGIRQLLEPETQFTVIAECVDGDDAIDTIVREHPDVVFLDVQMPQRDGFDVLAALSEQPLPLVVFVTAYDEYAVKAFETHALDYLVKPVNRDRFRHTIERVRQRLTEQDLGAATSRLLRLLEEHPSRLEGRTGAAPLRRLPIKTGDRIYFVNVDDIDWIEAADYYASLHTKKQTHLIRMSLNALEEQLDPDEFLRIHRSTIIRISRIAELRRHFRGDYTVILDDGTRLKLSRSYRRKALDILGQIEPPSD